MEDAQVNLGVKLQVSVPFPCVAGHSALYAFTAAAQLSICHAWNTALAQAQHLNSAVSTGMR
jgi:hypothetical protein